MTEAIPSILYHYTTLDKLALILRNQAIRFMPLSSLDDKQEARCAESNCSGDLVFVSCWTDLSEESIPMWSMYASLRNGVRIGLPIAPFKKYQIKSNSKKAASIVKFFNKQAEGSVPESFLCLDRLPAGVTPGQVCTDLNKFLLRVEYTDEDKELIPSIRSRSANSIRIGLSEMGKYKNLSWAFQHEWRYRIVFYPIDITKESSSGLTACEVENTLDEILEGVRRLPFDYFDFQLEPTVLRNIEIMLSPGMSSGNVVLAEELLARYGLLNNMQQSQLCDCFL